MPRLALQAHTGGDCHDRLQRQRLHPPDSRALAT